MSTHSTYLKEMGITEWSSREAPGLQRDQNAPDVSSPSTSTPTAARAPKAHWLFFGEELTGDSQALFQNILRVLGLLPNEWSWNSPNTNLSKIAFPAEPVPLVAVAFGGLAAHAITGERDPLPQLRETILALKADITDEIPVVATLDLSQLINKSKDKALLWQDLLLAKSVLQNS